jgi:ribosomal protein L12E/L44/L45/RPP1/RPP2
MNKPDKNIEKKAFDEYIHAISIEIEQAQVKLVVAANSQTLLHYWKVGNFILYNQKRLGWGSKFIEQTSNALKKRHPEKKGYSTRNLKYMCQFAKTYPVEILEQLHWADQELRSPTLEKVISTTNALNEYKIWARGFCPNTIG